MWMAILTNYPYAKVAPAISVGGCAIGQNDVVD